MKTRTVDVPEDLLALLEQSRLSRRSPTDQVKLALAIHLFQEGVISLGKAAELSGEPRVSFELLLAESGIPSVRYDEPDYDQDLQALAEARRRSANP